VFKLTNGASVHRWFLIEKVHGRFPQNCTISFWLTLESTVGHCFGVQLLAKIAIVLQKVDEVDLDS